LQHSFHAVPLGYKLLSRFDPFRLLWNTLKSPFGFANWWYSTKIFLVARFGKLLLFWSV
jgi:hypothetical protein